MNIQELVSNLNYNSFLRVILRVINESVVWAAVPVINTPNIKEMPVKINWPWWSYWNRINISLIITITVAIIIPPFVVLCIWLEIILILRIVKGFIWRRKNLILYSSISDTSCCSISWRCVISINVICSKVPVVWSSVPWPLGG